MATLSDRLVGNQSESLWDEQGSQTVGPIVVCLALVPTQNCALSNESISSLQFKRVGLAVVRGSSWMEVFGLVKADGGLGHRDNSEHLDFTII